MSRDGAGLYTLPSGYEATTGQVATATQHNSPLEDLQTDMNTARPIVAGGTGGVTAAAARTNLLVSASVQDKSTGYTVLTTDRGTVLHCTAALTLALTAAATLGNGFMVDVIADGGAVTIDPNAAETINGAATLVIPDGSSATVFCNGTAFYAATRVGVSGGVHSLIFTAQTDETYEEGKLQYNSDKGALQFFNAEADVIMEIGQEQWVFARNTTGVTITDGSVVYVSGASGNKPLIALADADTDATSKVIGVATHAIEDNTDGYVTVQGLVRNIDTSAFTAGNAVYLSTTAGGLVATPYGAGKFDVAVGTILNAHATQGILMVHPDRVAIATDATSGLVEKSTSAENVAGTSDVVWPTVAGTKEMIDTHASTFLATLDFAGDATAEFTEFDATKYDAYKFVIQNVIPSVDNTDLLLRTSTDGGVAFDSGASDYAWSARYRATDGVEHGQQSGADAEIVMTTSNGVGSDVGEDGVSGILTITGPHLSKETHVQYVGGHESITSGTYYFGTVGGVRRSAADVDAVQFLFTSGNLESGTITMYGMKNA